MENSIAADKKPENKIQPKCINPFENIALAFSGGGFRAASYALGVLSYLNEVQFGSPTDTLKGNSLLHQVTYLSSASGGTITAALYALYDAQGKPFSEAYVKLFDVLTGDHVLQNALLILSDKKRWASRPVKSRNIINAFALAYDEYIFDGATFQPLLSSCPARAHLQEVCFNTTEFFTGMSFRQNVVMKGNTVVGGYYKFGNENIFIDFNTAAKIKLSDALAASSCFPAGFEPIIFPNDFAHGNLTDDELKQSITLQEQTGDKNEKKFIAEKRLGFMDGGITDNQGLQSMMYADQRRAATGEEFDLMIVNDVGSYFIKPYVMPPQPESKGITLWSVNWLMSVLFVLAIAASWWGICHKNGVVSLIGGLMLVIPLIFVLVSWWLKNKIKGMIQRSETLKKGFTEKIIKLIVHYFTSTPLVVLKQMILARAESVLMLNMSVFLKRIRQLLYNKFYDSPEWQNRGKGNHIYDLSFSNDIGRKKYNKAPAYLNLTRPMQIVAQTAFNMGTTLWYDQQDINQQHSGACVIACGQFTTCYNLLQYIQRLLDNPVVYDANYKARLEDLKQQMLLHYERFKTDPFFMYNNYGRQYAIKNFKALGIQDIPFPENWA